MRILIIALTRSGHHAIIHWIASQMPGTTLHCNNCNENLVPIDTKQYGEGEPEHFIYNFEDFDLRGSHLIEGFDHILLVMRDPFNWIASSLRKGDWAARMKEPYVKKFSFGQNAEYVQWFARSMSRHDMYHQYAHEIKKTRYLKGFYDVNFNRWVVDEKYRKRLTKILGIKFTDAGKNFVPGFGGGSSFDEETESVLDRWKYYTKDRDYFNLLTDEMIEFSERYFNFNPLRSQIKLEKGTNPFISN